MPNRLTALRVDFVSMVPRPANQDAMFVLAKHDPLPSQEDPMPAPVVEKTDQPTAITKADLDAAIAAAIQKQATEYQAKLDEAAGTVTALTKSLEETTNRAQTAEAVAKAEQEARETAVSIAKAEKEMRHLPSTTPAELGPILRKLSKALTTEEYAKVEEVLKAASVAISKGDLFKERGSSYPPEANQGQTAYDQLEAVAKEFRAKEPAMTPAESITKAMDARPDLVKQDRIEKGFVRA